MAVQKEATLVRQIIRAAGGHAADVRELVAEHGPEAVTAVLVDEIVSRAPHPVNDVPVLVELAVRSGDALVPRRLAVAQGAPVRRAAPDDDGFVAMRVEYELDELVRELFGPCRERAAGTRGTTLFPYATSGTGHIDTYFLAAQQATATVLAGCTSAKPDLNELTSRYLTPKWGSLHWFTPHYDRHFREYRNEEVRVLEIGIGGYQHPEWGGGSLRMWKHFFHRGLIYGLDIEDKSHAEEQRITTVVGDQNDPGCLTELAARYGPFDIVIDDGSHINEHVRTSFHALFPHVRPGGLYVIEDLWTAYWPGFGGDSDPGKSDLTSLGLVKSLVDSLQHQELPEDSGRSPGYADRHVVGLHVYHNLAFIEKGVNSEGGIPGWIPRDFDALVAASSGGAA
ncbi:MULTISPECIES: class I SAM-dependent methyltransferase [Streptomyces]|uniref:Demethylmacrocin O-methyltransferase n=2 Tax=Streptomyces fradiae TaxID=1906 RepID=TYLE_STRFR|nr:MULTISPECIES: class I SAM-dependent methyltransferase [Streptomyces]Q9ZHQ4.1 RecName: Full=Demethylmacrocin O-methyltransferase; AltName: Full=Tylosin biosynthesis protein E [Streptomyces fradiae]AAD12164.1 methyltransferase [Streptomyces fradiae]AAD41815.1 demethylmacrocin O-methyltransferase TylE [Streptomyces fradiae]KNE79461.1 hypothetical protein ADZ36_27345 [Streptomyces fradiae]OFA40111.1 hypothetical protein BEN35_26005 [Streptomyces fradiae]